MSPNLLTWTDAVQDVAMPATGWASQVFHDPGWAALHFQTASLLKVLCVALYGSQCHLHGSVPTA